MRDKERIDRILKSVEFIWKNNPDLRFGQLVLNLYRELEGPLETESSRVFFCEDDKLEEMLKNVNV